jgi:hypothetical protein
MLAQGNALGFGINRCALQGRRNPVRPCRAEEVSRTRSRGVAPGWHAPRRWRVIGADLSSGETNYEAIYEVASCHIVVRNMGSLLPRGKT